MKATRYAAVEELRMDWEPASRSSDKSSSELAEKWERSRFHLVKLTQFGSGLTKFCDLLHRF